MTRNLLLAAALSILALAPVADASRLPVSFNGGGWSLESQDHLSLWANSPEARLAIDNRANSGFTNMVSRWQNLVAGSFVATPEGVVLGSSRDGSAISSSLSVPPGERQQWALHPNINGAYRFSVLGLTRNPGGSQRTYGELSKAMEAKQVQFSMHLGDAVNAGSARQIELFREQLKTFPFPTYALPGNDDLTGGGDKAWNRLFGKLPLSFNIDRDRFLMVDNARGTLGRANRDWLQRALKQATDERARHIFVFLHQPLVDPRPGINHGMEDLDEVRFLLGLFQKHHVNTVFASHLPFYARETRKDVNYVITGGGGDKLYGPSSKGGYHHFVEVEVNGDSVNIFPVRVP